MGEIVYQEEKYTTLIEELDILLPSLYAEVDRYPEQPIPNIDHKRISSVPDLQVITYRDGGTLVGFHISALMMDIFYKDIYTAMVLLYYVLPDNRGKGKGKGMFVCAEDEFKEKGVERIFMSRKIFIPNERLFDDLGYTQIEANYTKSLKQ